MRRPLRTFGIYASDGRCFLENGRSIDAAMRLALRSTDKFEVVAVVEQSCTVRPIQGGPPWYAMIVASPAVRQASQAEPMAEQGTEPISAPQGKL